MGKEQYAVYFPELSQDCPDQQGYLWVEELGSGIEGMVDLVRSVSDGQLYARKKTIPTRAASSEYHTREVFFHREHPLIPRLISHADCKVLRDGHGRVDKIKATVMIFQYCNGRTLADFSDAFAHSCRDRHLLTESVLWNVFSAQLETLMFLHNDSLAIMDNHMRNVFLNFPSESSKFPEFFTGDLGTMEAIDTSIWEPTRPGQHRHLRAPKLLRKVPGYVDLVSYLAADLGLIVQNLDIMTTFQTWDPADSPDSPDSADSPIFHRAWSKEFLQTERLLRQIVKNMENFVDWERDGTQTHSYEEMGFGRDPQLYNKLDTLQTRVKVNAVKARAHDPIGTDFSSHRYAPTNPKLWVDRNDMLATCKSKETPGPFKVAKVDTDTFAILELEDTLYGTSNPQVLDQGCNPNYVGGWSRTELVHDPLQDDTWKSIAVKRYSNCEEEDEKAEEGRAAEDLRLKELVDTRPDQGSAQTAVKLKEKRKRRQKKQYEKALWHRCRRYARLHRIDEECQEWSRPSG